MNMTPAVHVAMFGFPILSFLLFAFWRPRRRAILAIFLLGFLFLPEAPGAEFKLPGIPAFTKYLDINLSALLAVAILDTRRLLALRLSWSDLPIIIYCICPGISSLTNDLGGYDAAAAVAAQVLSWGVAYVLGKIYFKRLEGLRDLAVAIFIGGLIYVPLCLFEIRMSPLLHTFLYGYFPSSPDQTVRFGGFRPVVFLMHGLVVGLWMCMATMLGFWLWLSGAKKTLFGASLHWLLIGLGITTVLVKSLGALVLMTAGMSVALVIRRNPHRGVLIGLAALPLLYIGLRATGAWSGEEIVRAAESVSEERGGSLEFRLKNENMLAEKALRKPVFGWAGWGRARIFDEEGHDISVTDGLWIITLGSYGLVGLGSFLALFLMPLAVMIRQLPARHWAESTGAPAAMLATLLILWLTDCIPNAAYNPVYILAAGGMTSLEILWKSAASPPTRPARIQAPIP
jgi:hypothetical protein